MSVVPPRTVEELRAMAEELQKLNATAVAESGKRSYSETPNLEDYAMACCGSPDPAILEKNARLFCRNCKRYLDVPPTKEEADGRPKAGDAGPRDRAGNR